MADRQNLTLDGFAYYIRRMRWQNKNVLMDAGLLDVAQAAGESVGRSFEHSRTPDGIAFHPVKRGGRPLVLTGSLMRLAVAAAEAMQYTGTTYTAKVAEPFYAKFHQFGTSRILPREFFGIDDQAERDIKEAMAGHAIEYMVRE